MLPGIFQHFIFSKFEIYKSRYVLKNVENVDYQLTFFTGFKVVRGGNSPEVVIPPELCDWWWPASGGSAPSEKTRPGFVEHVSCGFC